MRWLWLVMVGLILAQSACNSRTDEIDTRSDSDSQTGGFPDKAGTGSDQILPVLTADGLASLQSKLNSDLTALRQRVDQLSDPAEKQRLYTRLNPVPVFVDQVLDLVVRHPDSPLAFDAALAAFQYGDPDEKDVAINFLLDHGGNRLDHLEVSRSLLAEVPGTRVESWLRKLVANAPSGEVEAQLLLGFKRYFDQIPEFRTALRHNPHIARRLSAEQRSYIDSDMSPEQTIEIESYLNRLIQDYGNLEFKGQRLGSGDTWGQVAEQEIYALRHLSPGKVAPDIVGYDLDGAPFKLSDYRGKVVMLDFWGHWCPPCRRMYPHERHIVQKLTGLPFALIGVNSDPKLETAVASVEDDRLPWRNFWNGPGGTDGPVSRQWNVSAWPTIYLIDANGVIRYKGVQGQDLDRGIEQLMAELDYQVDLADRLVSRD